MAALDGTANACRSHACAVLLRNCLILPLYFTPSITAQQLEAARRVSRQKGLGPEGQPVPEPFKEPPYIHNVEIDVVSEVGANVRVRVHQGAVESGPAYANHYGNQTQQ